MDNNDKVKLSVITASFNSEKSIEATFRSILEQDYRELEYIVVDGGSTDGTIELIKAFEKEFSAAGIEYKWVSEKDSGIYNAWNKGLRMTAGNWIAFIGSDDEYASNALSTYVQLAKKHPESDFICAKAELFDGSKFERSFGKPFDWLEFKNEMKILHAGSLHNKLYFERFGKFDESFKICGDYELLLRKGKTLQVHFIDQFLVKMQVGGASTANEMKALKEAKRAKEKNGAQGSILASLSMYLILLKVRLGKIKRGLFGSIPN